MKCRIIFAGVALPMLLVGCGDTRTTGPLMLEPGPYDDKVQQNASVLADQVRGTAVQSQAAQYLTTRALNLPTIDCMSAKGLNWDPPLLTASGTPATILEPLGGTTWLREPMRPIASQNLIGNGPFYLAEQQSNDVAYEPKFDAALNDCLNNPVGSAPSDDKLGFYTNPTVVSALDADLRAIVEEFEKTLPPPSEYIECMQEAGTDPTNANDSGLRGYTAVQMRLQDSAPSPEFIPKPGQDETTPQWDAFQATEAETLRDDAECRSEVYPDAITALGPRLQEFADAHRTELKQTSRHWEMVLHEARQQGFEAPSTGD